MKQSLWFKTSQIRTYKSRKQARLQEMKRLKYSGGMICSHITKLSETTGLSFISCALSNADFREITCLHLLQHHLSLLSHNDICQLSTKQNFITLFLH